jgi:hypothetical protein
MTYEGANPGFFNWITVSPKVIRSRSSEFSNAPNVMTSFRFQKLSHKSHNSSCVGFFLASNEYSFWPLNLSLSSTCLLRSNMPHKKPDMDFSSSIRVASCQTGFKVSQCGMERLASSCFPTSRERRLGGCSILPLLVGRPFPQQL